jgi:predicted secreted protein
MKAFKGDITVGRTGIFARRADQGLRQVTISAPESLLRHSARWQSIDSSTQEDVILPDATTLLNGWEIVIHAVNAQLDVEDDGNNALQSIAQDEAFLFTLLDNSSSDGVWHITALDNAGSLPATRFVLTHDATTDWGSPSLGYYTIATAESTHGRGTRPMTQFYETIGSDEVEVTPDESKFATATGDHEFLVPDDPDLRYAGKVIFV